MQAKDLLARIDLWWRATRAPFLTASIMPVLLGGAIAYHQTGQLHWGTFLLTLIGAVTVHLGANLLNDYGDHLLGSDARNSDYTPFSGGSRLIQTGVISPSTILAAGLFCLLLTVSIGWLLIWIIEDWGLLVFGLVGLVIALTYSLPPFKLAFRGLGEIAVSLAFGPLIVVGTTYVQTESLNWTSFLISIPAGLLVGLILFINEVQDAQADRASQKITLVVRLQQIEVALLVYRWVVLACFLIILILIFGGILPWIASIYLISLSLLVKAWHLSRQKFTHPQEILSVNALTIQLQIVFTGLLSVALLLDRLLFF